MRLVVRQAELGCRNGWADDLWVARDAGIGIDDREITATVSGLGPSAEPRQTDEITSIVAARPDRQNSSPPAAEDIVVQLAPVSSEDPRPATALVNNPRAAILRAREQYRARRTGEGRLADRDLASGQTDRPAPIPPHPGPESDEAAHRAYAEDWGTIGRWNPSESARRPEPRADQARPEVSRAPRRDISVRETGGTDLPTARVARETGPPVPPVTRSEISRPFPELTEFSEDARRFESVPSQETTSRPVTILLGETEEDQPAGEAFDQEEWLFDDSDESTFLAEPPAPRRRRRSTLERFLHARRDHRHPPAGGNGQSLESADRWSTEYTLDPESFPAEDAAPVVQSAIDEQAVPRDEETRSDPAKVGSRARSEAVFSNISTTPRQRVIKAHEESGRDAREQVLPAADREETIPGTLDPVQDLSNWPLGPWGEPEPRGLQLDETTPRNCRTCRDFRPSESGDRGWCNNQHAFNHRRMVDADSLPCDSSFGNWWSAHDDIWLRRIDFSRHGQKTPLMDRWEQRRAAAQQATLQAEAQKKRHAR